MKKSEIIAKLQNDKQCLMARCYVHTHGAVCRYCEYRDECEACSLFVMPQVDKIKEVFNEDN